MSEEQFQKLRQLTSLNYDEETQTVRMCIRGWGEIVTKLRPEPLKEGELPQVICESRVRLPHEAAHKNWIKTEATDLAEFNTADIFHVMVDVHKKFIASIVRFVHEKTKTVK